MNEYSPSFSVITGFPQIVTVSPPHIKFPGLALTFQTMPARPFIPAAARERSARSLSDGRRVAMTAMSFSPVKRAWRITMWRTRPVGRPPFSRAPRKPAARSAAVIFCRPSSISGRSTGQPRYGTISWLRVL